ncbi:MAG TPA: UDP-glucose/GDP-mannose dehydrogenase family protein [Bacteroidota bacterium]|nr:UDP-glucose/GDP-mannose dehydrogenase family protein [Bacteroidota bacterium]
MKISIIGTGYVGLVQGAVFADTGNTVLCMDVDEKKIHNLKKGIIPIFEPGLKEMVTHNAQNGRLEFTTRLDLAVERSEIIFLCLPTPQSEDGSADLSHVMSVAEQICQHINGDKIIVSKSTVPVGTVDKVRQVFKKVTRYSIDVVSNPEFLKEGAAIQDSLKPDRIVIGTRNAKVVETMMELYEPFVRTGNPILFMDEHSAELTKYASNSFLATKISFMNELANLCERVGADINLVRKGMGSDPRIGSQFLFAGVGYGGSCFPKDIKALIHTSQDHEYDFKILQAVDDVNTQQKKLLYRKVHHYFDGQLSDKTIAVWGLSFKPQTDDMREAPAIDIVSALLEQQVHVRVHDPIAIDRAKSIFHNNVEYFENSYDALKGAHALLIVTEWNEFRKPDFQKIKSLMKTPIIFDGRNIYDPKMMKELGFVYSGIGRK